MIVADASVLIAWLDDHDVHHEQAIDVLAGIEEFVVHPLTLAEVLVHPERHGRGESVAARLDAIGMRVSDLAIDPLALATLRVSTGLKMPDCVVLACADRHGLPVATFDRALEEASRPN